MLYQHLTKKLFHNPKDLRYCTHIRDAQKLSDLLMHPV